MRQRNDTETDLIVHTDPLQVLKPGDELDHESYVVGLTVLDEPPSPAGEGTDQPAAKKTTKTTAKEATQ